MHFEISWFLFPTSPNVSYFVATAGETGAICRTWRHVSAGRNDNKMADEDGGLEQAKERCRLLIKIKSTVDGLLASQGSNVWSTYGGLARITDDLEQIFRHGLLEFQVLYRLDGFALGFAWLEYNYILFIWDLEP